MLGSGAWQLVVLILVLGVVVVIHELGHFLAARLVGVRVEVFSFGFGQRLFGWRHGGTDYRVSLIPLGGYVRMAGEGSEGGPRGEPDELESRRVWEKLLVMAMGPAFNLVLAVLLVAGGYLLGVRIPAWLRAPVLVEHVVAGSPAAEAGLRAGDLVLQVDGRPAPDWKAFQDLVVLRPGAAVDFLVQRDGRELIVPVTIAARTKHAIGWVGAEPCHAVVVHSLSDGSPADRGGLRPGDVVLSVDGEAPCSDAGLIDLIQAAAGAPQRFVVSRDGSELALVVQAEMKPATERWMIGVAPALQLSGVVTERHGIGAALKASVQKNWEDATLVVGTVARLLTGRLSLRTTSGPLELAGIAANTADLGFVPFLNLMALVSLNLGILNLLPIPVLDGGRIVVLLFEGVRGRDLSARTKEWILQAGVVMILALMGLVLFFDLVKKLEG